MIWGHAINHTNDSPEQGVSVTNVNAFTRWVQVRELQASPRRWIPHPSEKRDLTKQAHRIFPALLKPLLPRSTSHPSQASQSLIIET